tara:strand:+ start:273 stop:467 length:195 start_codon:yes stop_codon:yes gene_type:complete
LISDKYFKVVLPQQAQLQFQQLGLAKATTKIRLSRDKTEVPLVGKDILSSESCAPYSYNFSWLI